MVYNFPDSLCYILTYYSQHITVYLEDPIELTGLWGLTVMAQCLSACLPPRHPNSLWLSYRPRVVGIDT